MAPKKRRKKDKPGTTEEDELSQGVQDLEVADSPRRKKSVRILSDIVPDSTSESSSTRSDAKERKEANKKIEFFVIKMRLSGFCGPEVANFDWSGAVQAVNQAVAEAYALANLYVLRELKKEKPEICKIDNVFFQTCLSIVTNEGRSKAGLRRKFKAKNADATEEEFEEWLAARPRPPKNASLEQVGWEFMELRGDTPLAETKYVNDGPFQASAKQMATNAQNMVVRSFAKRLMQYVLNVEVERRHDSIVMEVTEEVIDEEIAKRDDRKGKKGRKAVAALTESERVKLRADVKESLVRRFKKKEASTIVNSVFAKTYAGEDAFVQEWREKIPRADSGALCWDVHGLLPLFYLFLQHIEGENVLRKSVMDALSRKEQKKKRNDPKLRQLRTFSLLPTKRGFEASYVKFDSIGLRQMIKRNKDKIELGQTVYHEGKERTLEECLSDKFKTEKKETEQDKTKEKTSKPFIATSHQWWARLFNLDLVEKGDVRFAREITTDGYGVSILLSRPSRNNRKPSKKEKAARKEAGEEDDGSTFALGPKLFKEPEMNVRDHYGEVWGIDPGRTDFITATSESGKTVRFKSNVFRSCSGENRSKRQSNRKIDRTPGVRNLLRSVPTKKTSSSDVFLEHIKFLFKHLRFLLTFFMRSIFRKLKFRNYTLRNKKLDRACFEIARVNSSGKKTLVGFGDCGSAGQGVIKQSPAGPVQLFCRKLARMCEVVAVDEYCTSKKDSACESEKDLVNQRVLKKFKDGVERTVPVHKVLHCIRAQDGCGRTMDRDVNAAKNILSLTLGQLSENPMRQGRLSRRAQ